MSVTDANSPLAASLASQRVRGMAIVGGVIFAAALFGILTRPVGFLASFWPANAILLGMMVRNPRYARPEAWAAAFLGYIAADLVTGGSWHITLWLTIANMAGSVTGYFCFQFVTDKDRRLRHAISVLYLFGICCVLALVSALVGGGAVAVLFDRDLTQGVVFWWVTELANNLIILPPILTFPGFRMVASNLSSASAMSRANVVHWLPCLALILSVMAGVLIGGAGTLAFPMPALLWCALSYSLFTTSVQTMLLCIWLLIAIPAGIVAIPTLPDLINSLDSIRLGIALTALGPLTVASINSARRDLIDRLTQLATYDMLTGALSRSAFFERGQDRLGELVQTRGNIAVMMLDLDHFKHINDRHGHAVGDAVLKEFCALVSTHLRARDLFGRLGGEEFAVLLPATDLIEATALAERIRVAVDEAVIAMASSPHLDFSVSVGVSACRAELDTTIDTMLVKADHALYEAKAGGRNQVRVGSS
ncbi:diguanylate cyclase [Aminobacter anthyllidis]|uniref:diguanylate cyclase n=1 Tax=Aminobacter anthyllidis TaxID=1035067 RepID=A0A9X1AD22_9HYPH|nr:GGDEF domain-containing protein [Aminobacter anthyllidis]MBT1157629.1 diguanylate cyclase [Aminobacter anthyllidis]